MHIVLDIPTWMVTFAAGAITTSAALSAYKTWLEIRLRRNAE
jgi:hypothetical protein